ncbi:MAG: hypothetical protein KME11_21190 [Timaviella obliquedivisa GSE-PSE-MK23-08B]|nr:hypothetical protein [Timaviella obliquedivisa GSE-PSE-MK23-08B]
MCKICAIAARYPRVRQESLVFNLSQFAIAVEAKQEFERPQERSPSNTQEKSS